MTKKHNQKKKVGQLSLDRKRCEMHLNKTKHEKSQMNLQKFIFKIF